MSTPDVRGNGKKDEFSNPDLFNTTEYLSWRRLHLAKSKLNNVTEMASFMAGFAVVATVELQINEDDVRPPLLAAFVITTSFLVGTCMIAIIISTCVLPHIESVAKTSSISAASQSPHDKMRRLIDISWILTNSASLFFFTLDVIIMCWIKYTYFTIGASIAATVIMAPVLIIILVFAALFYRRIVKHQYVISSMKYEELERMHQQLERASSLNSISYQGTITSNYQTAGASNSLKKQWMLHRQQMQQNHFPPQGPVVQHPGQNQGHPHQNGLPSTSASFQYQQQRHISHNQHHSLPRGGHNTRSQLQRQYYSHPDHLPFHFSHNPNPNGHIDHRQLSPADIPTTATTPVSPSWSNKSLSPSVFTV